jgi:prevent-host-death family protein
MKTVKEETTLVGISELRTQADEILRRMQRSTVVIERRHKPLAVMLPIARYEEMEALLDLVEEGVLGYLARERERATPRRAYLPLEELERRLKVR